MDHTDRALEDLIHQLRGPLSATLFKLNSLLARRTPTGIDDELRVIRGLCRKANQVAAGAGIFKLLHAGGDTLSLDRRLIRASELIKLLIECAADTQLLLDPLRGIRVKVDRHIPEEIDLWADPSLLEQAVSCLLDNAAKYSYPHSTIVVSAKEARKHVRIDVMNSGIVIKSDECQPALQRGWRGEMAQMVTAEGTGLGLWVAHQIMLAHGGSAEVAPTTSDGMTHIGLLFPMDISHAHTDR